MEKNGTLASPAMALARSVLPVPGGPYHQYALGDTTTEALEFTRVTEKFHQFADIFLGFVDTGYIGKGGVDLITTEQLGLALAETHRTTTSTAAALHLTHKEDKDGEDQQYGKGCQ